MRLFRLPAAVRRDPAIDVWLGQHTGELGDIAREWFDVMRACGSDVREVMHDGHPTVCVGDAAFAYVNVFRTHVNVGFFRGVDLPDPDAVLQGAGRFMRHVKLGPGHRVNARAVAALITSAYADMRRRVAATDAAVDQQ